jgi:hypothetical protein
MAMIVNYTLLRVRVSFPFEVTGACDLAETVESSFNGSGGFTPYFNATVVNMWTVEATPVPLAEGEYTAVLFRAQRPSHEGKRNKLYFVALLSSDVEWNRYKPDAPAFVYTSEALKAASEIDEWWFEKDGLFYLRLAQLDGLTALLSDALEKLGDWKPVNLRDRDFFFIPHTSFKKDGLVVYQRDGSLFTTMRGFVRWVYEGAYTGPNGRYEIALQALSEYHHVMDTPWGNYYADERVYITNGQEVGEGEGVEVTRSVWKAHRAFADEMLDPLEGTVTLDEIGEWICSR